MAKFEPVQVPKGHRWWTIARDAYIMAEPLKLTGGGQELWVRSRPNGEGFELQALTEPKPVS